MPHLRITLLNLERDASLMNPPEFNLGVFFQALFWFLPNLQTLRLNHQFLWKLPELGLQV